MRPMILRMKSIELYNVKESPMFLETKRLYLRKFQEIDFDDFCEYAMDDDMCKMMGRELMKTREDARWNFNWLKDKEERCYGLVYKETGKVIGNITVTSISKDLLKQSNLNEDVGRGLSFSISKVYQRKGLMFESVNAVINHLFDIESLDYIQCGHFPINTASELLQKKLGFEYLTTCKFEDEGVEIISIENILINNRL